MCICSYNYINPKLKTAFQMLYFVNIKHFIAPAYTWDQFLLPYFGVL